MIIKQHVHIYLHKKKPTHRKCLRWKLKHASFSAPKLSIHIFFVSFPLSHQNSLSLFSLSPSLNPNSADNRNLTTNSLAPSFFLFFLTVAELSHEAEALKRSDLLDLILFLIKSLDLSSPKGFCS